MALSNYLCNKKLGKTAYIEINASNEVFSIGEKDVFDFMNITFYSSVTHSRLSEILQKNYKYFVLDFGTINEFTIKEFMRCDIRIALCSHSPWKKKSLSHFICFLKAQNVNITKDIKLLGNLVEKKTSKHFDSVPFIPNPFLLTSQYFWFFENLLERN